MGLLQRLDLEMVTGKGIRQVLAFGFSQEDPIHVDGLQSLEVASTDVEALPVVWCCSVISGIGGLSASRGIGLFASQ